MHDAICYPIKISVERTTRTHPWAPALAGWIPARIAENCDLAWRARQSPRRAGTNAQILTSPKAQGPISRAELPATAFYEQRTV